MPKVFWAMLFDGSIMVLVVPRFQISTMSVLWKIEQPAEYLHNILLTGYITDCVPEDQVIETMKRMAVLVDQQNVEDDSYINMSPGFNDLAFTAACDLAIEGRNQPNGYTEPILHAKRLGYKAK